MGACRAQLAARRLGRLVTLRLHDRRRQSISGLLAGRHLGAAAAAAAARQITFGP